MSLFVGYLAGYFVGWLLGFFCGFPHCHHAGKCAVWLALLKVTHCSALIFRLEIWPVGRRCNMM